jgi:hypothetical protein
MSKLTVLGWFVSAGANYLCLKKFRVTGCYGNDLFFLLCLTCSSLEFYEFILLAWQK